MALFGLVLSLSLSLSASPPPLPPTPSRSEQAPSPAPGGTNLIGIGLLLHAVGLGGNVWRANLAMKSCESVGDKTLPWTEHCEATNWRLLPVSMMTTTANLSSIGLIAAGSVARARHDSRHDPVDRRRRAFGLMVSGGVLTAVGVGLSIGLRAAMLALHRRSCDSGETFATTYGCRRDLAIGYFAGLQSSALLATIGVGLLSHSLAYDGPRSVSLAPYGVIGGGGVTMSGTF